MADTPLTVYEILPSLQLAAIAKGYGGYWAMAKAWGLDYTTLKRFFEGRGGLSGGSVATILERTRLPFNKAFDSVPCGTDGKPIKSAKPAPLALEKAEAVQ